VQTYEQQTYFGPGQLAEKLFQFAAVCASLANEVPIHVTLLNVVNLNVARLESRIYNEVCAESEAALKKLAKLFFGDSPSVRINVRVAGRTRKFLPKPTRIVRTHHHGQPEACVLEAVSRPGHGRARSSQRALPDAGVAANLENHAGTVSACNAVAEQRPIKCGLAAECGFDVRMNAD